MAQTILAFRRELVGKRVLITSGPTQEPIDDVRYITNRSSGKMGAALTQAALWMGAEVTVIAGPQRAPIPLQARVIRVQTALEMRQAALAEAPNATLVIGAAAVADYRPAHRADGKLRRTLGNLTLELTPNPDIIAEVAAANPQARVVGFAAEPTDDLEVAREKLHRKGLFGIAANDVSRSEIGFDSERNELTLLLHDGQEFRSGQATKLACALWLLATLPLPSPASPESPSP
jgi:phosphopantothenoylcysteine decarboxylase/phosphopantothenate--cysteine ligase